MKNHTLARPYAKAAYQYAKETGKVEAWFKFLGQMGVLFAERSMQNLLHHPELSALVLVDTILTQFEGNVESGMANFLKEVALQKRLNVLPEMVELFAEDWQKDRQVKEFTVTSATALSKAEKAELEKTLSAQFNGPVFLSFNIDQGLIGGVMIQSGDYVVDGSLKGQLTRLKYALRK